MTSSTFGAVVREVLPDGRAVAVKTLARPAPGVLPAEAEDLRWLGAAGGLGVPEVVAVSDERLVLGWVEAGAVDAERLGRGLAVTHGAGAGGFGRAHPTRFGALELRNDPAADYATLLGRRIAPLAARAGLEREAAPVLERLGELLGDPEPPARCHGDLWSGNVLGRGAGQVPVVIDPAAHGGHREADLAMLALFGTVPPRLLAAYEEVAPLQDGHLERRPLHQVVPLLVHALLFGGGYGAQAAAAMRAAARRGPA